MSRKALVVIDIQNDITKHYRDIIDNLNAAIDWATENGMAVVYISQAMQMFAYAVFIPAGAYFVNQTMAKFDQVKGQAYINCSITLGGVFSSLICGRLLDIRGPHFMLIVSLAVTTIGLVIAFVALKILGNSAGNRS